MSDRNQLCGKINPEHIGETITVCGWVSKRRDHGNIIFIDLRDRSGICQVAFNPEINDESYKLAEGLRNEYVVKITGEVIPRPAGTENPKIASGQVELKAEAIQILNKSMTPPFEVSDFTDASEELRIKHRYLDMRRPEIIRNLRLRHKIAKLMRDYFDGQDFLEVETPILTKSTPEGARDYLVPSRVNEGTFYALPQSPQLFKQLLMVGGVERYFQIAKCFRDEDLRADRQPEFTQLDLEMSFVDEDEIYGVMEGLLQEIFQKIKGVTLPAPFKRMTYQEAVSKYGSDKPDTRFEMFVHDVTDIFEGCAFKVFSSIIEKKGKILAINYNKGAKGTSRKDIDEMTEFVKLYGPKGLVPVKKMDAEAYESPVAKFFEKMHMDKLFDRCAGAPGDMILLVADMPEIAQTAIGQLRLEVARRQGIFDDPKVRGAFNFLWVTDFPLFKYNDQEKRWESEHHPFTSFHDKDIDNFNAGKLEGILSRAYDLVLNGVELGSGSIRIHQPHIQQKIFEAIGLDQEEVNKRFGFLVEAFKYGAPPHGGMALGIDRFVAILCGSDSIRDTIAFPKTQKAICPLTQAPGTASARQLKELGIKHVR